MRCFEEEQVISFRQAELSVEMIFAFLSIKSSRTPVLLLASSLQLALNPLDFRHILRGERDFAVDDYEQRVNECVSGNAYQFSEHGIPSWSELRSIFCIRNSIARREAFQADENREFYLRREVEEMRYT